MPDRRGWRLGVAAAALCSLGLLSIGIRGDWRLMHEDCGAIYTTLALSHLKLGLSVTRAHDLFYEPATGHSVVYGHHPPVVALLVASAFSLTGSQAPWAARSVSILFHLGSLLLLASLLQRHLSRGYALFGLFLFAILPMSAYFGRQVGYEPICLFAVLLELEGFSRLLESGFRRGLGLLLGGLVFGALVDWPAFFFAGSIAAVAALRAFRGDAGAARAALATAATAAAMFAFDVAHLAWANHGSLDRFLEVLPGHAASPGLGWRFLGGQLENYRRYLTLAGLDASILTAAALALPATALSGRFFPPPRGGPLRSLLAAQAAAPAVYVLVAPLWAARHAFWQFYFLPFTVFSLVLALRFLRETSGRWRVPARIAAVAFGLELVATTGYTLYRRHTEPGRYAVAETAWLRSRFLVPDPGKDR